MPREYPTTQPGYLNRNGQINIRPLNLPGTDYGQSLYEMACTHCKTHYAANGSDVHLRRCPGCQNGNPSTGGWTPDGRAEPVALTANDLSQRLSKMYREAPTGEVTAMMHLFGIRYAEQIEQSGATTPEIVRAAGIPESYHIEIRNGMNLAKYVHPI